MNAEDNKTPPAPADPPSGKKPKSFPSPCNVFRAEGTPAIPGMVLKLTEVGALIKLSGDFIKPGENCIVAFELPGTEVSLHENAKVIKTYQSYESTGITIELHFKALEIEKRNAIRTCIKKSGQK